MKITESQQKRIDAIKKLHPEMSADQVEFMVLTGLTLDKAEFSEYREGDIDWYYPKGAAFNDEEEDGSDEG